MTWLLWVALLCTIPSAPVEARSKDTADSLPSGSGPVITEIAVRILDYRGDPAKLAAMARDFIFLTEGGHFSTDKMAKSIDALKLSRLFQEINVDSDEESDRMVLRFQLKPFRYIKSITLEGVYPLFERDVFNVMTMYPGGIFAQDELSRQTQLIENRYKQEGFVEPLVSVTSDEDVKDGSFVVHVKIEKGHYYRLDKIDIDGNQTYSDATVMTKMKAWRDNFFPAIGGRFIEGNLKQDIKNLVQFYRDNGYFDVQISHTVSKDPESGDVFVALTIAEGVQYKIDFSGNTEFQDRTLRKELVFFSEGNINNRGLKKSIKKIKEMYEEAGYLEATVTTGNRQSTDDTEPARVIRFIIDEGPRFIVKSIQISGNLSIEEERILKQMLTRVAGVRDKGLYVPKVLEADLFAIKSLYLKEGYMDTEVKDDVSLSEDKQDVAIIITINEGIRTIVSELRITGLNTVEEATAMNALALKQGEPFRKYSIKDDENAISALVSEQGYPHVTVKGEALISSDKSEARVTYNVNEGPYVEMGNVYYTGNFRTRESILKNELELETGKPFSLVKVLEGQRNVRNMDIFQSVSFKTMGLKEEADRVNLLVDVEEKKPYFIEAGAGYESERGFFAHSKTGDHNLFGTNKNTWMGGEMSQIGYRADTGLNEPRLFGSHTSATLALFTERREEFNQDFGTQTYGSSLMFSHKFFANTTTGLGVRYERREQFLRDGAESALQANEADEFVPRSILVTTPSIRYDSRNSFIRPQTGVLSSFSVDISKGIQNSLDDFLRYRLDVRYFLTPLKRLTFALLGRGGYIQTYGSAGKVPDDQLFFLGGTMDVRGFSENMLRFGANSNPQGGRASLACSVEARINLGRNFELPCFFDTGTVEDSLGAIGSGNFRSSIGMGLRYITPIGPIGILYGIKLNPREEESRGRFHFSIGYTF
ncbi:MAG: outer membrane protein assembly factor BamA [Syntrophales bacterium]|nr:outer membrane protein assembly factor BamA [Syntrophales bacterium]